MVTVKDPGKKRRQMTGSLVVSRSRQKRDAIKATKKGGEKGNSKEKKK